MHSDAFLVTGTAHPVCQDYALAGKIGEQPFGIISDGCSSSLHTDVGSRLLTHSFTKEIPQLHLDDESFMVRCATRAAAAAKLIGLHNESLDATLLSAYAKDGKSHVIAVGDGVVAARFQDGRVVAWRIEYKDNAPEYSSYRLDPARRQQFIEDFGEYKTIDYWSNKENEVYKKQVVCDFICKWEIKDQPVVVAVMSDGVGSFDTISWTEVVDELMGFKNYKGNFVQRRMKRFIKECQQKGIAPFDDVSMAAIYMGQP